MDIEWLPDDDLLQLIERLRHAEGKDCNVAGDVLLYRIAEGNFVVVEQP